MRGSDICVDSLNFVLMAYSQMSPGILIDSSSKNVSEENVVAQKSKAESIMTTVL